MIAHSYHEVRDTSLLNYFPRFGEEIYNQKFRVKVHREIIDLLKKHDNLTDREMQYMLNYKERNVISPRRNELAFPERNRNKETGKPRFGWSRAIVVESEKRICRVSQKLGEPKLCIAWKLSDETLNAYLGE